MNQTLRVSFNSPQSGWMSISLNSAAESFVNAVSHGPYDSLRDLIKALASLLEDDSSNSESLTVKWNCEPDEFDFRIRTRADRVFFKVVHFTDHRRAAKGSRTVFSYEASRLEFCQPFWRALRDLRRYTETDEFDRNWRRPFPEGEMRQLTDAIRSFKRKAKMQSGAPRSSSTV